MGYFKVTFYVPDVDRKVTYTVRAANHNQACYIAHMQASARYNVVRLVSVCMI